MTRLLHTLCFAALLIQSEYSAAVVIIQYHQIDDDTAAATSIAPTQFAEHMEYLANNKFQVWALPRIIRALKNGEPLPDKIVAITFDDGSQSIHVNALPILQKYDFPFTIFINTSLVGNKNFMSWSALRELTLHGGTIANHTVNHPHLVRSLDGESEQQWSSRIQLEIMDVEKIIHEQIGHSAGLLAYPYGEYNKRVKDITEKLGLIGFTQHSGAFDKRVDWQAVPRFAFGGDYTKMNGFIDKVNSLPMPLQGVVVTDAQNQRLDDALLPANTARPKLTLRLASSDIAQSVRCFASDQGSIDVSVNANSISAQPGSDLPVGRSRINCTAPSSQKGRFYWYSHFFMRKMDDGSWYPEN